MEKEQQAASNAEHAFTSYEKYNRQNSINKKDLKKFLQLAPNALFKTWRASAAGKKYEHKLALLAKKAGQSSKTFSLNHPHLMKELNDGILAFGMIWY